MMRFDHISAPVVVLKSVAHGGLGILRSLGRLGVPVYVVDSNPHTPAFYSRYCRTRFLRDIDDFTDNSLTMLLDVARRIGQKSILIPTTDNGAIFVANNAEALREWFIFPNQSAELVNGLCSKKEMYFLAKRFGVPTAETAFPESRADVVEYLRNATFPVMLKGIDGRRLWKRSGKRMYIVHDGRDVLEQYETLEDRENPNLMLQEYIPGGDDTVWMFNGYFNRNSECLLGFTGKKIRQCPIHRGATSLGVCLKNEIVDRVTRDFMLAIGYQGILDIGYRYDSRDHQYKVLDINPRIGATFRLFVGNTGMDVVRALYLDMTGREVSSDTTPEGRKWVVEDLDIASSLSYRAEGALPWRQWAASFRGVREAAYFACDDPLPALPMLAASIAEIGSRIKRRLCKAEPIFVASENRPELVRTSSSPSD
jgi:predicted ATP-grasp superfamily ATP-dependent carboligase